VAVDLGKKKQAGGWLQMLVQSRGIWLQGAGSALEIFVRATCLGGSGVLLTTVLTPDFRTWSESQEGEGSKREGGHGRVSNRHTGAINLNPNRPSASHMRNSQAHAASVHVPQSSMRRIDDLWCVCVCTAHAWVSSYVAKLRQVD
jgi:hypothetical protein